MTTVSTLRIVVPVTETLTHAEDTMIDTYTMTETDFLSPAEENEMVAVEAGFPFYASEQVEQADEMAEAYSEYTRCGCSDPLCPCEKSPVDFGTFVQYNR